ncbi:MAG: type 2 isopentenyl-diphosphate Delta-isomerase [Archaeoglobaceae archaeon]
MRTAKRKIEHVEICATQDVESGYTGFEDVVLIHNALPEIDYDEVDASVEFLGKKLSFPFLIASMTGGHPETKVVNANIAEAVERAGIGMGVGSQRAAIEDASLQDTFTIVREKAPNAFVYANIGAPQLLHYGAEIIDRIVEMVDADAVAVHLNYLQEAIQPEGEPNARGCLQKIREVCEQSRVPVIVKETGAGISREVALKLRDAGVAAVDVGGKGGTSFAVVEAFRVEGAERKLGMDFRDWGIPTAFCVVDCSKILPTVATGGIRSGVDVAKAVALGAVAASAALPFLKPALESAEKVLEEVERFRRGFVSAMFLTSCRSVGELRKAKIFVSGRLKDWLRYRGIDVVKFMEGER